MSIYKAYYAGTGWTRRLVSRFTGKNTQQMEGSSVEKSAVQPTKHKPLVELSYRYREQFLPKVKKVGSQYMVSLRTGYVIERRILGSVHKHRVVGTEIDPDEPIWHNINIGDTVLCKYLTDTKDVITGNAEIIVVSAADAETPPVDLVGIHNKPKIGDSPPVPGKYLYPLFKFETVRKKLKLEIFSGGGPIEHYPARMWMENKIESDAVDALRNVHIVVKERVDDIARFKVVGQLKHDNGFNLLANPNSTTIDVLKVAHLASAADRQLHIEQAFPLLIFRGNSKNAKLVKTNYGSSPTTLLEWKDGFVTNETDVELTIAELPDGTLGAILKHNGDNAAAHKSWAPLAAPAAPSADTAWVLHHDGTTPFWELYHKVQVSVCGDSGIETYKFLGTPVV